MSFDSLGLAPELLRALSELGYAQPTPIQQQAIPMVLQGCDLMAGAQTGTGKTAAFCLPLLHLLSRGERVQGRRAPRALILTPTRELTMQVSENLREYGKHSRVSSTTIFGGVSMNPQIEHLRRGVDVIVATPGRLIDHLSQRTVDLSRIEFLILDEADRMLDMGFLPSIQRVLAALPKQRQTLLFSATFSSEIEELARQFMRNPQRVQTTPQNSIVASIEHRAHPVDASRKRDLVMHLIAADSRKQILVFTRTKHGANRLAEHLEGFGVRAAAIHGNKSQNARTKALNEFKSGKCTVLVATDIAARGIDIDDLPLVINYDLPTVSEDYVHRIGRTGRNGRNGEAISLVSPEEGPLLRDIQRLLKRDISLSVVEGFDTSRPLQMDGSLKNARRPNTSRPANPAPRHARSHPAAPKAAPKHAPRSGTPGRSSNPRGSGRPARRAG